MSTRGEISQTKRIAELEQEVQRQVQVIRDLKEKLRSKLICSSCNRKTLKISSGTPILQHHIDSPRTPLSNQISKSGTSPNYLGSTVAAKARCETWKADTKISPGLQRTPINFSDTPEHTGARLNFGASTSWSPFDYSALKWKNGQYLEPLTNIPPPRFLQPTSASLAKKIEIKASDKQENYAHIKDSKATDELKWDCDHSNQEGLVLRKERIDDTEIEHHAESTCEGLVQWSGMNDISFRRKLAAHCFIEYGKVARILETALRISRGVLWRYSRLHWKKHILVGVGPNLLGKLILGGTI